MYFLKGWSHCYAMLLAQATRKVPKMWGIFDMLHRKIYRTHRRCGFAESKVLNPTALIDLCAGKVFVNIAVEHKGWLDPAFANSAGASTCSSGGGAWWNLGYLKILLCEVN